MAPVKKKTENVRNLRYPESSMQSAIKAVREGRFKLREAGRHYGVPHNTLSNKLKGVVPEARKMGRATYLTKEEEKLLVSYIIANAKKGIPLKRQTLVETVKKIIDEDGRKTPFKNNHPGRKWVDLFKKRHPQLCEKKAEGISTARANVSESDLRQWSEALKQYLEDEGALDILDDPKRIYNADESGFRTCPESGRVLGPVGMKNFFEVKSGKEKEQLTVMACINAAGQTISPMIVYPLVRISKDIACNVPTDWSIGRSPKGWMTGPLYYEYIANVFDPWLKQQNINKPVLLLVDGHRSHMTMQVSEYCADNQILMHALYPNSTHITQPADVSLFKCLKSGWQNTVFDYKQSTGNKHITRAGFAPLLSKVFQDKVTPEIISNGFKRCGIYPFDPSAVDYSKCMDNEVRKVIPSGVEFGVETVLLLESFMRRDRATQFRNAENGEWQGDESAKELFYVWKKFRRQCSAQECAAEDVAHEQVPQNTMSVVNEQESSCTRQDNNMPLSPSIMRTPPPPASLTDSTRCSSVSSPLTHNQVPPNTNLDVYEQEGNWFSQDHMPPSPSIMRTPPLGASLTDSTRCSLVTSPITHKEVPPKTIPNVNEQEGYSFRQDHIMSPPTLTDSPVSQGSMLKNRRDENDEPNKSVTAQIIDRTKTTPNTKLIQIMAQKQKLVSPAFGNHLLFPSDSPIKKYTKDRLPLAVSSSAFRTYFQQKEKEKESKTEQIEKRRRLREEIKNKKEQKASKVSKPKNLKKTCGRKLPKMKKTKPKRQVLRSDSETENDESDEVEQVQEEESEESSNSNVENIPLSRISRKIKRFSKGDYVIIRYEEEYFPGEVTNADECNCEVSTMTFSTGNTFRWPEKPDKIWYSEKDIIEHIDPPVLTNKRGFYVVKEMAKFLSFTV